MRGLFITGIDTAVGKTHVTCLLARRLSQHGVSVGVYKPVCSGAEFSLTGEPYWPDLERLSAATGHQFPREWICPQIFQAPLAPPLAAAQEGREVDAQLLRSGMNVWRDQVDFLLVEGVGGWMCPLTATETIADLARDLASPVLVVAANRLGMLSHTLLTLQSLVFSELRVAAAVVNPVCGEDDGTHESNAVFLRNRISLPVFGPLAWQGHSKQSNLRPSTETETNWLLDDLIRECVPEELFARSLDRSEK